MYFDHAWYARTYPQMAASGLDPVRHYLEVGCAEGCDPNPIFRSRDYLAANPDVAALGQNPFLHFVMYGQTERRRLKP